MSRYAFEIRLTEDRSCAPDGNVTFNEETIPMSGIEYNASTGIVKFKETGQYTVKWWVATETTLRGAIGFHLVSSKPGFLAAPGCSSIKMGQVTGFAAIDVDAVDTTIALMNKSPANTVISKKSGTKAYMLVTPIGSSSTRVYRGDLSTAGSLIEVPLGDGVFYRLENRSSTRLRLNLLPMNGPTRYDYRRFCSYNGAISLEGDVSDNELINGLVTKDGDIYNNSQEMHWVLIRVQSPLTSLWSTYEVRFFASGGLTRVTVWVNVIEEEVSYG